MNYLMKKAVNLNGQDMMLAPLDIDFAHRTISLTGEIDEDVATVMNSALRCLARDSEDDITIYIQSLPEPEANDGVSLMLKFLSISRLAERVGKLQTFASTPNTSSKRVKSSTGFSPSVLVRLPKRLRTIPSATTS